MSETKAAEGKVKPFILSKYFVLITLFMLLACIGLQTFNSTTALYVEYLGGSPDNAGLMLTCFTIAATAMRFAGNIVEKLGRVKVMFIGAIIFAVGAVTFNLGILNLLYVCRFIQGIGYSLATTAISVAITDVIPQPRMSEGIGYHGLAQTLPMAIAPTIALALCNQGEGPFSLVFVFATVILILVAAGSLLCRYDKDEKFLARKALAEAGAAAAKPAEGKEAPKEKGFWFVFEKTALPVVLPNFSVALTSAAVVAFLTLYAKDAKIENVSLYYTLNVVVTIVARFALGRLMNKLPTAVCVIPGFISIAAGFVMLMFGAQLPVLFYIAGGFVGLGNCLISPPLNAEVVRRAAPHRRGAAISTFLVVIDIGIGVGAYLWGVLLNLTQKNYNLLFAMCIGCCVVGIISTLIFLRPKKA